MSFRNKKALVTGGAGFIGSHLVDRIIQEDTEVVVVDNFFLGKDSNLRGAKDKFPSLRVLNADAGDLEVMKNILQNENIDIVFDLATIPLPTSLEQPKLCWETNIRIVFTLCELIRDDLFNTLVHFSSSEAYGSAQYIPMDENHPMRPTTPYAASKAAQDHLIFSYCKTFGIDATIVRPFNTYGPRQNEGTYAAVIPITIKRIFNRKKPIIHGDGMQTRDYSYVSDVVDATVCLSNCKASRGRVVNVASGTEIAIKKYIEKISEIMGWKEGFEYFPPRPGDVRRHKGNANLLKKLTGFQPKVNLDEGIRKTVKWYEKQLII